MWRHQLVFLFFFSALLLEGIPCSGQASQSLTLQDAEKIAIQNHPQIQAATYLASAAAAQVTGARSAYFPQAYGSLTGVGAEHNSRVAAGALNNPIIFHRFAEGLTLGQLVTAYVGSPELGKS